MQKRPLSMGCLVVVVFLALMVCFFHKEPEGFEAYEGDTISLQGMVYQKEQKQNGLALYLEKVKVQKVNVQEVNVQNEASFPLVQRVVCYLRQGENEPELGSMVNVKGKLQCFQNAHNPGEFDVRSYYQILRISFGLRQTSIQQKSKNYHLFREELYQLRSRLSERLSMLLPREEASLMKTILLGEKAALDEELKRLYQRNGIAHILAISGLHISMLGMGFYQCIRRIGVPRRMAAIGGCVVVVTFGMMTGFSVSAIRAILMFLIQMIAILVGRTYDMVTAIAVASVWILVEQPLYLKHAGFLFSFGCVLGISLLSPVLTDIAGHTSSNSFLLKKFLEGLSMTVVTLPMYFCFFYQIPIYAMFLNFLILPLMSILMAAGILLLIFSYVFPGLCICFSWLIVGILQVYEKAGIVAQQLPHHYWTPGQPAHWQVALYLLILICVAAFGQTRKRVRRQVQKQVQLREQKQEQLCRARGIPVLWCWLLIGLAVVIISVRFPPSAQITFLDVGQGDCIFVRSGREEMYLVDGGSSSVSEVARYRILPFLKSQGASRLQAIFVTHPDEDHCNGITEILKQGTLEGICIQNLVLPDIAEEVQNDGYRELVQLAREQQIPVTFLHSGQDISFTKGAPDGHLRLQCLHPEENATTMNSNEYSIVLQLQYQHLSVLLTGDVEDTGESAVMEQISGRGQEEFRILKVAHHGSKNSTSNEFLERLSPQLAIISCGKNNRYGHPHEETLKRLENAGARWLCTKDCGAITVTVDKKGKIQVKGYIK